MLQSHKASIGGIRCPSRQSKALRRLLRREAPAAESINSFRFLIRTPFLNTGDMSESRENQSSRRRRELVVKEQAFELGIVSDAIVRKSLFPTLVKVNKPFERGDSAISFYHDIPARITLHLPLADHNAIHRQESERFDCVAKLDNIEHLISHFVICALLDLLVGEAPLGNGI